ncbi:unnamed protein product [Schistosoma margrebowiei]|uniref:Uncharacterized protein n=1 Tax=Schistosoma margrebowiei TaxID=48269 RepID=A0A183MJ89_9TREM|nr:unnamed protein product [Schistosoma margrebowiei]
MRLGGIKLPYITNIPLWISSNHYQYLLTKCNGKQEASIRLHINKRQGDNVTIFNLFLPLSLTGDNNNNDDDDSLNLNPNFPLFIHSFYFTSSKHCHLMLPH